MKRTLLFVHGTGVRQAALAATLDVLRAHAVEFLPDWKIEACAWGDAWGAVLQRGGSAVPGYARTGGSTAAEAQDRARWVLLADDPLIELRLAPEQRSLGQPPGGPLLWQRLQAARDLDAAQALVGDAGPDAWSRFVDARRADAGWRSVVESVQLPVAVASRPMARALVAALQAERRESAWPALGVARRDALQAVLEPAFGGPPGAAVLDWFARRLTNWGRDRRGRLTDLASPAVGDILRYQARGDTIVKFVAREAARTGATAVLAHSLGGIAAVDWLASCATAEDPSALPPVQALITVGSQAAYFYEIDALRSRALGSGLPAGFPARWTNIWDDSDALSYPAAGLFKGRVLDVQVDNGEPFPEAHGAYWGNRTQVWPAIADALQGL